MSVYASLISTSQRTSALLGDWLARHEPPAPPIPARCIVPAFSLPTPPLAGTSRLDPKLSVALSTLYAEQIAKLKATHEEQFNHLVAETSAGELHSMCTPGGPCVLLKRTVDTLRSLYSEKLRAMSRDVCQMAAKAAHTKFAPMSQTAYVHVMEFAYAQSTRLNAQDKGLLAQATGRTVKQIGTWFQNRRTRDKTALVARRDPPKTLGELEEKLHMYYDTSRVPVGDASGYETHDSGYASAGSSTPSAPSMKDITNMMQKLTLDERGDVESPAPTQKSSRKPVRQASTSSKDKPSSARPKAGKPKRSTVPPQVTTPVSATQASTPRAVTGRATARSSKRTSAQHSELSSPNIALVSPPLVDMSAPTSSLPLSAPIRDAATKEAEATSSNKATRPRKKAALPARRPKASRSTRGVQVASSSSSGSSVPSLSPSSSRSSSLSSDPFFDLFSSPTPFSAPLPQTEPVYYTKNANGEFVPVTTPIVVRPQIVVPPPVHIGYPDLSLDLESLFDHPSLGPVGPQMVAPDSDPRAFSSNILGSTMEPVITTEDFSALLELLSETAGDASTSGTSALDLTSAMPPLQGPPLNTGHDASSIAPIPDPTSLLTVSDYDFGSVVWPEFDETSWSQLLGLA